MELRQLRYLAAVVDQGQFTRAARSLNIAQPALSQQIQKFERQMGVALLDRTTRHVSPTPAGEILLEHGRRMLAEAETATAELQALIGLQTGRLVIGASPTLGGFDLSRALADFHRDYPGVELAVSEQLSFELASSLMEDSLDVGFVTLSPEDRVASLEEHEVATEELVCIVAPSHRLSTRNSVALKGLRDEPFAMFAGGATIRLQVERVAASSGFTPRVVFETNDLSRLRGLVSQGLAVAIVPRSDAQRPGENVHVLKLGDKGLTHHVYAAWRAGRRHSPAARRFIEMVLAR
jgi:DNA-binding transcriptional LysR family regulator